MGLNYPSCIIEKVHENHHNVFQFDEVVCHLLSLVSNVHIDLIRKTKIYPRSAFRFIPWYKAEKGGGAITFGSRSWHSMTFTENFFSQDSSKFINAAYGNEALVWLKLCAHEVVHIAHAQKFGSFIYYLFQFAYQYLIFGHDKSPLELEADISSKKFNQFQQTIDMNYGQNALINLIKSDSKAQEKKDKIDLWWNLYMV